MKEKIEISQAPELGPSDAQKNEAVVVSRELSHQVGNQQAITASDECKDDNHSDGVLSSVIDRKTLIITYLLIWLAQFALVFSSGTLRTLTPYITSAFERHSLTATTSIIASIVSGIVRLPYAKSLDIWGRPQGLLGMVACTVIGCLMMAVCSNVETYCAAQVFYNVGYYGILFSTTVFISDSSPLRDRAFLMGFTSSPSIASVWAYGPATEQILRSAGWRWGCGIWCIILPVFFAPMVILFFKFDRDAKRAGLVPNSRSGKSFIHYLKEFDIIGLALLAAGLSLLLLALSIYSYQAQQWKSPLVICFIVFAVILVAAFVAYELYLAPITFLPWQLIKDRTAIFTNIMAATLYTSEFMTSAYIYSVLIVVFNQTVTQATFINNIYLVGASFWSMILGVAFRYYGHIKYYAIFMAIPFFALGTGLMIKFRGENDIGLMVMCEIFLSFGGGTIYPIEQMNLMAVSQDHFPSLLAVNYLVVDSGKAAGAAIATSIWTAKFEDMLRRYLPASEQSKVTEIYGSLGQQSSYPVGTPARDAINHAYVDTQRVILIVATSLLAPALIAMLFWRDIDVKKSLGGSMKQSIF